MGEKMKGGREGLGRKEVKDKYGRERWKEG